MMTVARLTCLWPGLPRLWFRGEWGGLALAFGFAALVNFLLATTLVWPELAPPALRAVSIVLAPLWWVVAAGLSWREWPEIAGTPDGNPQQGLFVRAQREYLRGNWLETESCLRRLLRRSPRDVEALLLFASLARRTERFDEARARLQALARLESSARWQLEIRTERELLRRAAEKKRLEEIQTPGPTDTSPDNVLAAVDNRSEPDNPIAGRTQANTRDSECRNEAGDGERRAA